MRRNTKKEKLIKRYKLFVEKLRNFAILLLRLSLEINKIMNNTDNIVQTTHPIQTPSFQSIPEENKTISSPINVPKINLPIIISIIFVIVLVGLVSYYLGTKKNQSTTKIIQERTSTTLVVSNNPTQKNIPSITPSVQPVTTLPIGWIYKSNGKCGVKFPIPPKEKPYYISVDSNRQPSLNIYDDIGRFWDFPRGGVYPNLLSKLITDHQEHKQAAAMYATIEEASGYISSAVVVSCIPNSNNLTNLTMLDLLQNKLQSFNNIAEKKEMEASAYVINSFSEVNRWNKKVYDLSVSEYYPNSGGKLIINVAQYTMFTTPKYIYEVRVIGATENMFVKETARKIFDNLLFE